MRQILVTGANKGIGHAIAKRILEEHDDTFVFLGSRDLERGERAKADLGTHAARVKVVALDVSDERSVSEATSAISGSLYGVVNNAGIGDRGHDVATVLATNVFGTQRVTEAFLPRIADGGRVVNISSASGPTFVSKQPPDVQRFFLDPTMTWPRLRSFIEEAGTKYEGSAYGFSKACVNLLTMITAREHPKLVVNGCTPGYIATDMTQHHAEAAGKTQADLGMKSTHDGANAPLFLLFGTPEGNGRFYGSDCKRSPLDRYRAPGSDAYTGP
jgi:carbonyl reductase 1